MQKYLQLLASEYPGVEQLGDLANLLKNIITDKTIALPQSVFDRALKAVTQIFKTSQSDSYLKSLRAALSPQDVQLLDVKSQPSSALMAYDFHYDAKSDRLALIEINTNASAFLLSDLLYKAAGNSTWSKARTEMLESFYSEATFFNKTLGSIAILDETPSAQRMFIEFLMYQDLFKKQNLRCEILDVKDFNSNSDFDLIYNRFTDFTLSRPESAQLRQAYVSQKNIFSPHPGEYIRLADKAAQVVLSQHLKSEVFLETILFEHVQDWDQLWSQRKKYVFKPQRSHGAKAVYRGESVSRKKFDEIREQKFLAQEYFPPGVIDDFKFDLRFFAYKDRVQLAVARLFQGQVLNFGAPGSGLAQIKP